MDLRRISPAPTLEDKLSVVSVPEVLAQARVDFDDSNDLIAAYIEAAYDYLDGPNGWLGGMSLLPAQFEWYASGLDRNGFDLPMRPLFRVPGKEIAFDYWTGSAYAATDATSYLIAEAEPFARVERIGYTFWPYYGEPYARAYRLTFWAGFPDAAAVPSGIKMAIRLLAAHWYQNREAVTSEGKTAGQDILYGVRNLAGRYRIANDHS